MFILCSSKYAVLSNLRCGHLNMHHYFGIAPYTAAEGTGFTIQDWQEHHNPIVVLRNPLERLLSAKAESDRWIRNIPVFIEHSRPYLHLLSCDFRIIDFYDLEQYIPRKDVAAQSLRSDSRVVSGTTAQDVYVENTGYTLLELQREFDTYKQLMATRERVTVEEWKELTNE